MTIGVACVGWTLGSVAGLIGAPIAGHPVNMLAMIPHFVLSVFIANGIRRGMEQVARRDAYGIVRSRALELAAATGLETEDIEVEIVSRQITPGDWAWEHGLDPVTFRRRAP